MAWTKWKPPGTGDLRHIVTIKAVTNTDNADGTWTPAASGSDTRKAAFDWMAGAEFENADSQKRTRKQKVCFRYYEGLTAGHQLLFGSRTLDIVSVEDVEERKMWMIATVQEVA